MLSGCAVWIAEQVPYQDRRAGVFVIWRAVDNVDQYCRDRLIKEPSTLVTVYGCAGRVNDFCVIYTGKDTTTAILGHELRHCFDGSFHD